MVPNALAASQGTRRTGSRRATSHIALGLPGLGARGWVEPGAEGLRIESGAALYRKWMTS
jgi:hypothetical protein